MKKTVNENRVCRNKKCQRPLPAGYKHRYCEACRNKQAENLKTAGKAALGALGTAACVAIAIVTNGKINPKE